MRKCTITAGFSLDAVGDAAARAGTGLLQKYRGRALLVATGSCAIHCRYCFRRHFPYAGETAARDGWREAIQLIHEDTGIEEVILSGGDPLSLSTPKLGELTAALARIGHLRRLRIHTRLPMVLPERVDLPLLQWLRQLPWPVAIVLHANHANEFDASVDSALTALRGAGVQLLNQAVLLRGQRQRRCPGTPQRAQLRCWRAALLSAPAGPHPGRFPLRSPR